MGDLFPTLAPALWRGLRFTGRGIRKVGRILLYALPVLVLIHLLATLVTGQMVGKKRAWLELNSMIVPADELIPKVPPGERNAAEVYLRAFDALRLSEEDRGKLFDTEGDWGPPRLELARRLVSANSGYYRLLEDASRIEHCVFPVRWHSGAAMTFPHHGDLRDASGMLDALAHVMTAEGDYEGAAGSFATALRIAEHVSLEPDILPALVGSRHHADMMTSLENLLARGNPTPETCRALFDQIDAVDIEGQTTRAFQGNAVLTGIRTFDQIRRSQLTMDDLWELWGDGSRRRPVWYRGLGHILRRPLMNLDEIAYLKGVEWSSHAFRLPWPGPLASSKDLEANVDRSRVYYPLTYLLTPHVGRFMFLRMWRSAAPLGAAQIALAAIAYEGDYGRLPESLGELELAGWDLPDDPFGGEEYRYRLEGEGFVVWSIGPDLDDDNAARDYFAFRELPPERQEGNEYDYDVIFRCER